MTLLELGADVYGPSPQEGSRLELALRNNYLTLAKELMERGFDVNFADKNQETALHKMCSNGTDEKILFLLEHGADVKCKNAEGKTPLEIYRASDNCSQAVIAKFEKQANELQKLSEIKVDRLEEISVNEFSINSPSTSSNCDYNQKQTNKLSNKK
ncbi:ankyrin repeat domain-containing protein [Spiroplasma endosymbiont of Nebria brevicollis]|uniref:ankyrin repeat domain-containing protein n=1 Tax=Spiroplasma endosymbiont of Nebria brevicollis TaxID=3066284 RepID=UPI00313EFFF1